MEFNINWAIGYLIIAIIWYIFSAISIMFYSDKPKNKITTYHFMCCVFAGLFWPLHMFFVLIYLFRVDKR